MTNTLLRTDPAADHVLRVVLEERIHELLAFRRWYREHTWTCSWPTRYENDAELRALVRLARHARRIAATAADPASYTDAGWTESELAAAFGR